MCWLRSWLPVMDRRKRRIPPVVERRRKGLMAAHADVTAQLERELTALDEEVTQLNSRTALDELANEPDK